MKKTERLWRALEATPVLSGVRAVWKEIAGEDLPSLQPFLRPSAELATTYPCPEPGDDGCPRGVVIHAHDDIVAVCRRAPRSCEKLKLDRDDIVIYTLDLQKIAAQLRALFGLAGDGTSLVDGLARTLHLGAYRPAAGLAFPVYMSIQNDRDDLAGVVERLAARDARSFILITPTTDLVGPRSAELLRARGGTALGLADFTRIDKDGKLVSDRTADEVLKGFHDRMLQATSANAKDGMVLFPTPSEATWSDVEVRFKDGHTISVKVLGARGVFNYTQMGMANKKNAEPTVQWKLLKTFAEEDRVLTWKSSNASRKNQKTRENLSKDLRRFFRIEGDPISLTEDKKGWRVIFELHDVG
jgi:hypothetical protein